MPYLPDLLRRLFERMRPMVSTMCPACETAVKGKNMYLCYECWSELPLSARNALKRTDMKAMQRLQELYDQIHRDVELAAIRITP
jgi:hypothetical protein